MSRSPHRPGNGMGVLGVETHVYNCPGESDDAYRAEGNVQGGEEGEAVLVYTDFRVEKVENDGDYFCKDF